jgi:hypothetical protein
MPNSCACALYRVFTELKKNKTHKFLNSGLGKTLEHFRHSLTWVQPGIAGIDSDRQMNLRIIQEFLYAKLLCMRYLQGIY